MNTPVATVQLKTETTTICNMTGAATGSGGERSPPRPAESDAFLWEEDALADEERILHEMRQYTSTIGADALATSGVGWQQQDLLEVEEVLSFSRNFFDFEDENLLVQDEGNNRWQLDCKGQAQPAPDPVATLTLPSANQGGRNCESGSTLVQDEGRPLSSLVMEPKAALILAHWAAGAVDSPATEPRAAVVLAQLAAVAGGAVRNSHYSQSLPAGVSKFPTPRTWTTTITAEAGTGASRVSGRNRTSRPGISYPQPNNFR